MRTLNLVVLVLIGSALFGSPTFAQSAQWQPYNSPEFQFSIQEPGTVTVGTIPNGHATTFTTVSNNCQYIVIARKLSPMELAASWFASGDALWNGFLKGYGSKPTTVKDMTGQGWTGKAFTRELEDQPHQSGIFCLSTNGDITYCAIVAGPTLTDDATTYLKSFVVTEKPDSSAKAIALAIFLIVAVVIALGIILLVRFKKK